MVMITMFMLVMTDHNPDVAEDDSRTFLSGSLREQCGAIAVIHATLDTSVAVKHVSNMVSPFRWADLVCTLPSFNELPDNRYTCFAMLRFQSRVKVTTVFWDGNHSST